MNQASSGDFDNLDIGTAISYENGEGVIVGKDSDGYTVYEGHIGGKPQQCQVTVSQILGMKTEAITVNVTELTIKYTELCIKILGTDILHGISPEEKRDILEGVLQKIDTMVTAQEDILVSDIELIVEEFFDEVSSSEEGQRERVSVLQVPDVTEAIQAEDISHKTKNTIIHNATELDIVQPKAIFMKGSSTDIAKGVVVPSELAVIKSQEFPVSLGTLSVSELLPVAEIIESFVKNPYDIEVLREFRERIYETLYRSSGLIDELDNAYLDTYWIDENISFDEVGILLRTEDPGKRYINSSSFGIRNDYEKFRSEQSVRDGYDRDRTARIILHDFDVLIKELGLNPEKMEDATFRTRLDEEIAILSDIVWTDSEEKMNPLKINTLSKRKSVTKDSPVPRHTLPALWHAIQTQVLTVRLHEQAIFVEKEYTARLQKSQNIIITPENQTERVAMRTHLDVMYRYFCDVKGISYGKKNKNSTPRTLTQAELRIFRNSLAQFDVYIQKLTPEKTTQDIAGLIGLDI